MSDSANRQALQHDRLIDPAPRAYASSVTILRRETLDHQALAPKTLAQVEDWLLCEAVNETDLLALFQAFVVRLTAAGLPVHRANLHVGTLHPQLFGYAWAWNVDDGLCDEVKVGEAALATDGYRKNPLSGVIEQGVEFRARIEDRAAPQSSPLLRELADMGFSEYAAFPLNAGGTYHNAATVATRQAGGFLAAELDAIRRFLKFLALHVERHIAILISQNIARTYLGDDAGRQVLDGSIKRGSGEAIDAIIWASDLRDFTALSKQLSDRDLTALLNNYFDVLAGSVLECGGDVLKFIGDGLLAVFPFASFKDSAATTEAAIRAAEIALGRLKNESAAPAGAALRPSFRTGIALHRGEAFFGNVGTPGRLDFTVIGSAVNVATRVEGLCKPTGRDLLLTEPVAALTDRKLDNLGSYELRGLDRAVAVFALSDG